MGEISINSLGALVMDVEGVPMSDYFAYINEMREELPVICAVCYVDKKARESMILKIPSMQISFSNISVCNTII